MWQPPIHMRQARAKRSLHDAAHTYAVCEALDALTDWQTTRLNTYLRVCQSLGIEATTVAGIVFEGLKAGHDAVCDIQLPKPMQTIPLEPLAQPTRRCSRCGLSGHNKATCQS